MMHPLEPRVLLAFTQDPTFGVEGVVAGALSGGDPTFRDFSTDISFVRPHTGGTVVVGGTVFPEGGPHQVRVARYTSAGLPDPTFGGGDGFSDLVPMRFASEPLGGAIQPDGKILIGTNSDVGPAVTRFNPDGSLDTAFGGGDGVATAAGVVDAFPARDIALGDDGKIVILAQLYRDSGDGDPVVIRYNPDGTPDATFGEAGVARFNAGSDGLDQTSFPEVEALPGGKVLVLGRDNATDEPFLARLSANGSLDTTFGGGDGVRFFRLGGATVDGGSVSAMLREGDKIVVGGSAPDPLNPEGSRLPAIARFNADGSFDTTFGDGGDGVTIAAGPANRGVSNFVRDSQGRYVSVVGFNQFLRFTPAGVPDETFGPGGVLETPTHTAGWMAVDASDRILLAGGDSMVRLSDLPRPEFERAENGTLIITMLSGNNTITIEPGAEGIILVTRNGVTEDFTANALQRIDIQTGGGDDSVTISVLNRRALVNLGDGDNTVIVPQGDHVITTGSGADEITAGNGDSTITSGDGPDTIMASGGRSINSEGGDDVVSSAGVTSGVLAPTIAGGDGNDVITLAGGDDGRLLGGDGNDSLTGGTGEDALDGQSGDDTLVGGGADDLLVGEAGDDLLLGGAGDDHLFAFRVGEQGGIGDDDSANVLDGGDGDDYLVGSSGRDTLRGGAHRDILIGHAGSDLLTGGGGNDKLGGGGGPDRLYGGNSQDKLDGGTHNDRLSGQSGDDVLGGGRGNDFLSGGGGADRFFTRDGVADTVDGNDGDDTAEEFDDEDEILSATGAP